ncbi:hypothetical protein IW262DRAFT_1034311 [Armillaria fumosa]|nr:hypothetical protein IW262DRAFT_1034311 [Armillaria fumosa]
MPMLRSGYLTNFEVPTESIFTSIASLMTSSSIIFLKSHIYWSLVPLRHTHESEFTTRSLEYLLTSLADSTSSFLIAFKKRAPLLSSSSFATADEDPLWLGDTCSEHSIVNPCAACYAIYLLFYVPFGCLFELQVIRISSAMYDFVSPRLTCYSQVNRRFVISATISVSVLCCSYAFLVVFLQILACISPRSLLRHFIWLSCQIACISLRSLLRHVCSVPPCGQYVQLTGRRWSESSFCNLNDVSGARTLLLPVFGSSLMTSVPVPCCSCAFLFHLVVFLQILTCISSRSLLRHVLLRCIWLSCQIILCISLCSLLRHVCSVPPCGLCVQLTGRWWSE